LIHSWVAGRATLGTGTALNVGLDNFALPALTTAISSNLYLSLIDVSFYSEGLIWVPLVNGYINRQGETIIQFPQFDGMMMAGSPFENGYAALYIIGADGNFHITITNRDGEVLYDPMPIAGANGMLSDGYVVFWTMEGNERVFQQLNIDGTTREIMRSNWPRQENLFAVREGFMIKQRNTATGVTPSWMYIFICIETGLQIGTFD